MIQYKMDITNFRNTPPPIRNLVPSGLPTMGDYTPLPVRNYVPSVLPTQLGDAGRDFFRKATTDSNYMVKQEINKIPFNIKAL